MSEWLASVCLVDWVEASCIWSWYTLVPDGGSGRGNAGGGGGITGDGAHSLVYGNGGGRAVINGAAGGASHAIGGGAGGYGCGGGSGQNHGSGGGGYTGGNAANFTVGATAAMGGSSFAVASALGVTNTPGGNLDPDGRVELNWVVSSHSFSHTGGLQSFTIPAGIGAVTLTARGAQGGNYYRSGSGGRGGEIQATIPVTAGATLQIIVGGRGASVAGGSGGGGGGTFVAAGSGLPAFADPLLVAGGGAGADSYAPNGLHGGVRLGGHGGGGLANVGGYTSGGGGGGARGDGQGIVFFSSYGGRAAVNGGAGGISGSPGAAAGGYGGGGSSAGWNGNLLTGGGGGYQGGDALGSGFGGKPSTGGSSYAHPSARNVSNTPGGNPGYGSLTIQLHYVAANARPTQGTVGCGSPALTLDALGGSTPRLGQTFVSQIDNVPAAATLTSVGLGLSTTSLGAVPLPLDLGIIGAPGCMLYHDMIFGTFITMSQGPGIASLSFTIPMQLSLIGGVVHQQALSIVPGANPLGLVTSNDLELMLGF